LMVFPTKFFINLFLLANMSQLYQLNHQQKWVPGQCVWGINGQWVVLTTYYLHVSLL
jgi:hypothetical protein